MYLQINFLLIPDVNQYQLTFYCKQRIYFLLFDLNIVMESHGRMSSSTQLFLIKLKDFLESIGVSFSEFFSNFETINKSQLSKLEFFRIISLLHIETQSNFDPQQVFSELARKQQTIQLGYLKKLHSILGTMINQRKISEEKSRQDEMQKKMIRIGIYKLQDFMRKHEAPLAFLRQFDRDGNGGLSKNQFNSFLLATDIRELSSKDIRRIIIEHTYKYFQPRKEITMKELADFFKINRNQAPRVPIFPIHNPNLINNPNVPIQRPNSPVLKPSPGKYHPETKPQHNPFGKKKAENPNTLNIPDKPKFQIETQETSDMDNHISNCYVSYPNAIRFYRQGDPAPSEHANMQQMEELLTQGKKFIDGNNPAITQGSYVSATDIFKTEKYHMFQMASSVLVREVSRIGIARQIQPKDIIQGSVGDCYFLSSIASIISIYPELIAERFLFNKNPANYYAIKLFIDGEWIVIKTDERFPCRGNTPLYAKPHTQQIWVMLLEKCWAKVFGSYRAIESGSSKEGFMALTGAPSEIINHDKDINEIDAIKQVEIAHGHKYVATVSGSQHLESLGKAGEEKLGIVSGHAYSLLKTIKVGNETLVKLRNPWGKTTWKGLWSFQSSQWTKQLRNKYNYNRNPDDGSFYMSWKDFSVYFGEIVVCKLNPTFLHSSIHVKTDRRKSGYVLMRVKTAGQYIISLYQQNKRKFINKYTNYEYSQARVIILRREGKTFKYMGAKSTQKSQACSVDLERLEEGQYIISAKAWWKFWDNHEMIVTVYGTDYASLSPVNRAIAPEFKAGLIKSYASQFAGTGKVKSYEKYGFNATCESNFNIDTGIGYLRMVNNSEKSFESVQEMNIKGLKVIKPDRLPLSFKMTPKTERVVGFFVKPSGYEYSSTEKITY